MMTLYTTAFKLFSYLKEGVQRVSNIMELLPLVVREYVVDELVIL
jgi:hypothetical protein